MRRRIIAGAGLVALVVAAVVGTQVSREPAARAGSIHCHLFATTPVAGTEDTSNGDLIAFSWGVWCESGYAMTDAGATAHLYRCPGPKQGACPGETTGPPYVLQDTRSVYCNEGGAKFTVCDSGIHTYGPANDDNLATVCWFLRVGGHYTDGHGTTYYLAAVNSGTLQSS